MGFPVAAVKAPGGGAWVPKMQRDIAREKTNEAIRQAVEIDRAKAQSQEPLQRITIPNNPKIADALGAKVGDVIEVPKEQVSGIYSLMGRALGGSQQGEKNAHFEDITEEDEDGELIKWRVVSDPITGAEKGRYRVGAPAKTTPTTKLTEGDKTRLELANLQIKKVATNPDLKQPDKIAESERIVKEAVALMGDKADLLEYGEGDGGWWYVKPKQEKPRTRTGSTVKSAPKTLSDQELKALVDKYGKASVANAIRQSGGDPSLIDRLR